MIDRRTPLPATGQNAVTDVRRIRAQLDHRFRGDIEKLCAHAHRVSGRYVQELNLRCMPHAASLTHHRRGRIRRTK